YGVLVYEATGIAYRLLTILITMAFSIGVFWIYGLHRVVEDFHFTLGYELEAYWTICWKIIAFGIL
ncbi:hypothetical protein L9F63_013611, partial [Diploptera punctata]